MATNLPDGSPAILKYLFEVTYKDGKHYIQNPEDISVNDPTKSCFFDVDKEKIKTFTLKGEGHTYLVDLADGHFEIDSVPFQMHQEPLQNFRIVYYRVRDTHFNLGWDVLGHEISYWMGWQANDEQGRNHKQIMEIK